uniref:AlNc14C136G7104 protein n=1 Tax=Albugo laibachii Nc14 TaxID=890382 RepID=F0WKR4_9STRA|nr:AlNc14C136G7104 [Albugo laibachii Nc14]|eukprot:CCA21871.1 AlNc14C136G7104 [Albugo laibachii Nc14]
MPKTYFISYRSLYASDDTTEMVDNVLPYGQASSSHKSKDAVLSKSQMLENSGRLLALHSLNDIL